MKSPTVPKKSESPDSPGCSMVCSSSVPIAALCRSGWHWSSWLRVPFPDRLCTMVQHQDREVHTRTQEDEMTDTPTYAAMRGAPALVHSADPLPSAQAELGQSLAASLRQLPAALSETPVNSVSVSRAVMLWLVDSWNAVRRCRRQRRRRTSLLSPALPTRPVPAPVLASPSWVSPGLARCVLEGESPSV